MMYDYIIIGGGPTGLTLAWYLSQCQKINRILLIDKNKTLGGCHRVVRTTALSHNMIYQIDNLFTEHGPRVYGSSYVNTKQLLINMGLSFDDYVTKYNFGLTTISNSIATRLHLFEIKALAMAYLRFVINSNYGKHITVADFMNANQFSHKSKQLLDQLCRITEGGDSTRYTLYEFLQLINQNAFYSLYVNKVPNDLGLIKDWTNKIIETNKVDILTETNALKLVQTNNQISGVVVNNLDTVISGHNFILAIPPQPLVKLLENCSGEIRHAFGPFSALEIWELVSRYDTYICGMFYWKDKFNVQKSYGGFTTTDWGIIFIELSDYMHFPDMKTAMCITISKPMAISKYLGKSPNECTKSELLDEMFRQLNTIEKYSEPNLKILYPKIHKKNNGVWESEDTAFLLTKAGYGPNNLFKNSFKSVMFNNLYSVGPHTGRSVFVPTTMESAVENAINLVYDLVPEFKNKYRLKKVLTIRNTIYYFIGFVLLCALTYLILR